MQLRNESRIRHSIEIKLVFDDNRTRELSIKECDFVQVSYRKNGCMKQGVGIIKKIEPYKYTKKFSVCKRESAVITLDMSDDYVCCTDKFDLFDIIDIRKVQLNKPNCQQKPDLGSNNVCHCPCKNKNKTGAILTEKGVVIRD